MKKYEQWNGFKGRLWKEEINVRDFIQNNYTPYDGDASFLEGPTEATDKLWEKLKALQTGDPITVNQGVQPDTCLAERAVSRRRTHKVFKYV